MTIHTTKTRLKKVILILLISTLVIFSFNILTFASTKSNLNHKKLNILFNNNYLGANVVLDIKSLKAKNIVIGWGFSKNQYEYSDHYREKGVEIYFGKHFTDVKPLTGTTTIDLATGLNSEEGIILFLNTTFKYGEKFGVGIAINTGSGLMLNFNFDY